VIGSSRNVTHRLFWLLLIVTSIALPNAPVASETVSPGGTQNASELQAVLLEFRDAAAALDEGPDKMHILRQIAAAQAEAGDVPEAAKTVTAITDARQEVKAWSDIWFARAMAGDDLGESLALQNTLRERNSLTAQDWSEVYEIVLQGMRKLIREGKISAARRAANAVPELPDQFTPQMQFLYLLARQQLKREDYSAARTTLRQLLNPAATIQNKYAHAWLLMKIAGSQAEAGDGAAARATFRDALKVADTIQDSAHMEAAKKAIGKAQQEGESKIALAYAKLGDIRNALDTAAAIRRPEERSSVLVGIAEIQARAEDVQGALETASAIQQPAKQASALVEIAEIQATRGAMHSAREVAERLPLDEEKSRALTAIAVGQAERGDLVAALETAAVIPGTGKAHVLRTIGDVQAKSGDRAAALDTWRKAATVAIQDSRFEELTQILESQVKFGDVPGARMSAAAVPDNSHAQMKLVEVQAAAGDVRSAIETVSAIRDARDRALALEHVAAAQARTGSVGQAVDTAAAIEDARARNEALAWVTLARLESNDIAGALVTATGIEDDDWKSWTFVSIARAQIEAGDNPGARDTLRLAEQAGEAITDDPSGGYGYTTGWAIYWIAQARIKAGDLPGAFSTAASSRDKDARGKSWVVGALAQTLAIAAAKEGGMADLRRALAWANEQREPNRKIEMTNGALLGLRGESFQGRVSSIHGRVMTTTISESPGTWRGSFYLSPPQ
jgi:tetratricopeptide (TPR) repeat protein